MKHVTLDWDTYKKELEDAKASGIKNGIYDAGRYIINEKSAFYFETEGCAHAWADLREILAQQFTRKV
jgi:hypothetical protein